MSNYNDIGELLFRSLKGDTTPEEEARIQEWISISTDNAWLLAQLRDENALSERIRDFHPENRAALRNRILGSIQAQQPDVVPVRKIRYWKWIAAAVVLIVATTTFFLLQTDKRVETLVKSKNVNSLPDAPAGKEGAVLTLADGSSVALDQAATGEVARQGGDKVLLKDGVLRYEKEQDQTTAVWNTVATPNARQFSLVLPDGSRVWLNAASSVRYPSRFVGNERKVEVSGEVYFEVTKNAEMPFVAVTQDGTEIRVLGTHFNINAYPNEPVVAATLLEGSVLVRKRNASNIIKPGEQALVQNGIRVRKADVNQVMAWKEGFFNLNGVDMAVFFRQLARWYDIEVQVEGALPDMKLWGEIYRGERLQHVLRYLEKSGFRFSSANNGKTLIVAVK